METADNTYPVGGIMTEQIASMYDFFKIERVPELFARYGTQFMPMFGWLQAMGREEAVVSDSLEQWEENRYTRTVTVLTATPLNGSAGDNPGAGEDTYVVLDPADLDDNNNYYPREGDIVQIPGNETQAIIYSIDESTPSAPKLQLRPVNEDANIGALLAGTELIIMNAAFGAGTTQPKGTVVGTTKRTFYAQILKESVGAEGSQLVNEEWYSRMDDGRNIRMWYTPGTNRGEYLLGMKTDGAFTFGQEATNSGMVVPAGKDGAGNKIRTTKGAIAWTRDLGKVFPIVVSSFDIPDLNQVGLYLKSQGITSGVVLMLVGAQLNNAIEDKAVDYLQNTAVDFTSVVDTYFGGSKSLALSVGFKVITKGGFTFLLKTMDLWSNPTLYGASGYDIDKFGLLMPLAEVRDPKNPAQKIKNIGCRYRALGNYSRRFEVWNVGGAGPGLKVEAIDRINTYFRTHMMFTMIGANQFVLLDPS